MIKIALVIVSLQMAGSAFAEPQRSAIEVFDQTADLVTRNFYDRTFRGLPWPELVAKARGRVTGATTDLELEQIVNGLLGTLNASHTEFISDEDEEYWGLESVFSGSIDGAPYKQIGAHFQQVDGRWYVRNVFSQTPAQQVGLLAGDEIISVNGKELQPVASFQRLRIGQQAKIRLRRNGRVMARTVPVIQASAQRVLLDSTRASTKIYFVNGKRIGYFHLWSGTHPDFKMALAAAATQAAHTTDALILDLRDGFGGAAPDFLNPFFDHDDDQQPIPQIYSKPMVALINDGVRSGKEWLADVFKQTRRATLIGDRTSGHFLAGKLYSIEPGKFDLFLAVDKPTSLPDLEGHGVPPDIAVPWPLPHRSGGDPQLRAALQYLGHH